MAVSDVYVDMLAHVREHDLEALVLNADFVRDMNDATIDPQSDAMNDLHEMITDMFHDRFGLCSRRRRVIHDALRAKTHTLRELYEMHEVQNVAGAGGAALSPPGIPGGAVGLTGPFPVSQGQALQGISPTPSVFSHPPTLAAGEEEEHAGPRERAPSPQRRFGDIAGILRDQPLVQLVAGDGADLSEAPEPPSTLPAPAPVPDPAGSLARLLSLEREVEKQQ